MTLHLYGFWRSIAAFRVRVALRLKNLAFEETPIDLMAGAQFSADYDQLNASHVVPTLVHDEVTLFQSLAIMEYLDEIAPEPALLPATPKDRAYCRALAQVTIADAHPLMTPRIRKYVAATYGADAHAVEAWAGHWSAEGLANYERLLTRRPPAPFALGAAVSLADIAIASHSVGALFFKVSTKPYPTVEALAARCFELPAFALSHPMAQPGAPKSL